VAPSCTPWNDVAKRMAQSLALLVLAQACTGDDDAPTCASGAACTLLDASADLAVRSDAGVDAAVVTDREGANREGADAPVADVNADVRPAPGTSGVLQYHNHASRDGLYIDSTFTKDAAARLHMDATFHATIQGPTYAQALYFDDGAGGKDIVFAATEQNQIYALDAANGSVIWQKKLGEPVAKSSLPCGSIDPLGITGTPVIDALSRRIFVAAMTTPDGGTTKKHLVFSLSIDDGSITARWPIDVAASLGAAPTPFDAASQNQRGGLALVNGVLYVPYGAHGGDCGMYRGWVVGVPIDDPASVQAFATRAPAGGIWAVGGLASDGSAIFAATGNTKATDVWGHGEAILRFRKGPTFSEQASDYFAPSNWKALDDADLDVGGTGPVLLDVPGATPSQLVIALGKNGVAYVVDRTNLGGIGKGDGTIGEGLDSAKISSTQIFNGAAAYRTPQAAYVVTLGNGIGCPGAVGDLTAIKISATAPPRISVAWCAYQGSNASPMVTTTDGLSDAMVWGIGAGSSNRMFGFDGDSGQVIFAGGGPDDAMSYVRGMVTAIAAKGRIFVAADAGVFAFTTR